MRTLPLDGIRVIDLSRVLAGPFATMLLADLGADVIKVEPPEGDDTRAWGPPWWGDPSERRSAYFASVNRNKRSIVLDLRTDAGRAMLDRLLAGADLLVHNYRPATAARLGVETDALRARHPSLVVASVGGFGGEEADRPAYDLLAQAMSGLMSVTGEPDGPPIKAGVAVLDLIAGLECAVGALAALVGRGRAGSVQVNLMESSVGALVNVLGHYLASGDEPGRFGSGHPNIVPYQAFAAVDGHLVIAVGNDRQFGRLLEVLGLTDPEGRYATNAARVERREELVPWLAAAIGERGRDELVAALTAQDVPAGPVLGVGEAIRTMGLTWVSERDGIAVTPGPILVEGELGPIRRPPPRLGEHTDEIVSGIE